MSDNESVGSASTAPVDINALMREDEATRDSLMSNPPSQASQEERPEEEEQTQQPTLVVEEQTQDEQTQQPTLVVEEEEEEEQTQQPTLVVEEETQQPTMMVESLNDMEEEKKEEEEGDVAATQVLDPLENEEFVSQEPTQSQNDTIDDKMDEIEEVKEEEEDDTENKVDEANDDDVDEDDKLLAEYAAQIEEQCQDSTQPSQASSQNDVMDEDNDDIEQVSQGDEDEEKTSSITENALPEKFGFNAHPIGRCDFVISQSTNLITGGIDGKLKIFSGLDRKGQSKELADCREPICSLAIHPVKELLAVGLESGGARLLRLPSGELENLLIRAPGPIRALAFSPNGEEVAIGLTENTIKVVNLSDTTKIVEVKGHKGPIRALAWDPKNEYLASTSCDGTVCVWSTSSWESVHQIKDALEEDFAEDLTDSQVGKLSWSPDGKTLAFPGKTLVRMIERATWKESDFWIASKACSIARWSPNGIYLACTSEDGRLVIFDAAAQKLVANSDKLDLASEEVVQSLEWFPKHNRLAFVTMDGEVRILGNVVPSDQPSPFATAVPVKTKQTESKKTKSTLIDDEAMVDDDEEEQYATKRKANNDNEDDDDDMIAAGGNDFDDDEDNMDEELRNELKRIDAEAGSSAGVGPRSSFINDRQLTEKIAQAVKEAIPRKKSRQPAFQPGSTAHLSSVADLQERQYLTWSSVGRILVRVEDLTNAIEVEFNDLSKHRNFKISDSYGFNMASLSENGVIFASTGEFGANAKFGDDYDQEDWDPVSLASPTMNPVVQTEEGESVLQSLMEKAEMQERGIIPMDQETTDKFEQAKRERLAQYGNQSTIFYRPLYNNGESNEWALYLPAQEKPRCVLAGDSFCAIATNRRMLRIFRPTGLQEAPIILPGPVVSMAGASSLLFVIYHMGEPSSNGTQNLGYLLYDVGSQAMPGGGIESLVQSGKLPVPVREEEPIRWVGITDKTMGYMPLCLDSKGMLMGLSRAMDWAWVPLLDTTRLDVSGGLWPVSVQMNKLMVVVLQPGRMFPAVQPRPPIRAFDLQIPLLGLTLQTGKLKFVLEEASVRGNLVLEQLVWSSPCQTNAGPDGKPNPFKLDDARLASQEAQLDAEVIKHFVLAIKLKNTPRALGLMKRIRRSESLNVAMAAASKENADSALLEKLHQFREMRLREDEEAGESDVEEEEGSDSEDDDEQQQQQEMMPPKPRSKPSSVNDEVASVSKASVASSRKPLNQTFKRLQATTINVDEDDDEDVMEQDRSPGSDDDEERELGASSSDDEDVGVTKKRRRNNIDKKKQMLLANLSDDDHDKRDNDDNEEEELELSDIEVSAPSKKKRPSNPFAISKVSAKTKGKRKGKNKDDNGDTVDMTKDKKKVYKVNKAAFKGFFKGKEQDQNDEEVQVQEETSNTTKRRKIAV